MKKILTIISCIALISGCANKAEVKLQDQEYKVEEVADEEVKKPTKSQQSEAEKKIEIAGQPPKQTGAKFTVEDQDVDLFQGQPTKPIMVAVMAPMSGKHEMLGNGIMDGAHIALIELFKKDKIPVRLTAIDTGSGIEDMEFNISKLDEAQFDVILGLTSESQRQFVNAYIENFQHKPRIMSLLQDDCGISLSDQIKLIKSEKAYLVLPINESASSLRSEKIKIMQYNTDDVETTNNDLMKIAQIIEEETREKQAVVVFTESNWKLQKFIANLEALRLKDMLQVVLASLSQKNSRMESVNEKRHKFGDIAVIGVDNQDYNRFINEFNNLHNRKPLDISFLAYNAVKSLKDGYQMDDEWSFEKVVCKPEIKLFEKNYR